MTKNISEEDVHQAVGQVVHPEINSTLVELGMVKDVALNGNEVTLTLVLPFRGIPDVIANSLREEVAKLGANVEISIAEMNQEEKQAFFVMEQEGWKGS